MVPTLADLVRAELDSSLARGTARFDSSLARGTTRFDDGALALVVGRLSLPALAALQVTGPEQGDTPAGGFAAAVWGCERAFRAGLETLKSRLADDATLFVSVAHRRSPWELARDLVVQRRGERPHFEELCEGLLLAGYVAPRVLVHAPAHTVLCARTPTAALPLDGLFAQPA